MNHKLSAIGAVSGLACIISSIGLAAGVIENPAVEDQALILHEFDRLHIETPVAADFAVMNVRVFNSDNELVMNVRSSGEPVDFMVSNGLPDGDYNFEAVSVFTTGDLSKRSEIQSGAEESMLRHFGSFTVSGGEIIQRDEPGQKGDNPVYDEASLLDRVMEQAIKLAGATLDVLIPSAQAANLVASSQGPAVIYDDTDLAGVEWVTFGNTGSWGVADQLGDSNHWVIRTDGIANSTLNIDSMIVDPDGDIHWGSNGLNYDRGGQALSLGTTAIRRDVTISSLDPAIDLFDESTADSMGINYNGNDFIIYNSSAVDVVKVHWEAPPDSLHIQSNGHVGLGTSVPNADLNVVAGNTAQIRVDNTTEFPAAGDQAMFRLQSVAANKVRFLIGNKNGLWTFDNAGSSFQINLAGTGVNEFRVENDGDIIALKNSFAVNHVNTSSRNSKTDFAPIDEIAILEKLSELPMSTWRYKIETEDERHLGPIAEDFQLAFGLSDGKHISTVDASGVALTAIKGLNKVLQKRTAEIVELTQANSDLISANRALDERLTRLENVLFHQDEVAVR